MGFYLRLLSAVLVVLVALTTYARMGLAKDEIKIDDPVLKEKYLDSAKGLRCPTCTGLSILESDAEFSVQIKLQVRDQVQAGKNGEQIRQYFVDRYGPWILREPPKHGFNAFAWIFPIGILALGPIVMWILIWRRKKTVDTFGVRASSAIVQEFHQQVAAARASAKEGTR